MVTVAGRHPEPLAARELTYASYLRLPELLDLQQPRSGNPDELHFVVVHQAMELWFRLLVSDQRRLVMLLDADRFVEGCGVLRRGNHVVEALLAQMRTLRALPPESFQDFRESLGTASGFQSAQFRELEVLCGLRDETYLTDLRTVCGGTLPEAVTRTLGERSVARAHQEAALRSGLARWADLRTRRWAASPLYALSELLLDFDDLWLRWRTEHVSLVRRMIGGFTPGTGGTSIDYLERTLRHRFFPYLWEWQSSRTTGFQEGDQPYG
ncbi:tryptophan 2,3-dioxygenase family protein [Streptomyces sp. TR06-5]|uniref:tryptophan 2,3-dioxygenase family protein n=1 Tax=unclassified Streptomyces TaxID=2593676 RepID=UPI0039A0DF38